MTCFVNILRYEVLTCQTIMFTHIQAPAKADIICCDIGPERAKSIVYHLWQHWCGPSFFLCCFRCQRGLNRPRHSGETHTTKLNGKNFQAKQVWDYSFFHSTRESYKQHKVQGSSNKSKALWGEALLLQAQYASHLQSHYFSETHVDVWPN